MFGEFGPQRAGETDHAVRADAWDTPTPSPDAAPDAAAMKPPARPFAKTSAGFEAYYRGCGIMPDDEWGTFVDACRTALPTSFSLLDHPAASDALTHRRFVRLLERLGAAADGHGAAAEVDGPGLAVASGAYVWTRLRVRGPSRGPTQGAVRLVLGIEAADEPVRCAPLLWFPRRLGCDQP